MKKKIITISALCIVAVAICIAVLTNFSSIENYCSALMGKNEKHTGTVTICIRCDTIKDTNGMDHIPEDRIILKDTEVKISEGDTVYDVLKKVSTENKILVETSGSGDAAYVEGIANIYMSDFGELSGWLFYVNDESASVPCGQYTLTDGDYVEWLYTCNMGEDID